jgi:hypothetical protein
MGILSLFRRNKMQDPDAFVLLQLRKSGSNLSKPHPAEFFLYFPTQASAEQAAGQIRDSGFQVQVGPAAKGDDWLCFATKEILPDLPTLQKIRTQFESLSKSLGGEYDGWGTPLVQ